MRINFNKPGGKYKKTGIKNNMIFFLKWPKNHSTLNIKCISSKAQQQEQTATEAILS